MCNESSCFRYNRQSNNDFKSMMNKNQNEKSKKIYYITQNLSTL